MNKEKINNFIILTIILLSLILILNSFPYNPPVSASSSPQPLVPPTLSGGTCSPSSGDKSTLYTFQVTFTDKDNDPPNTIDVNIGGYFFDMYYLSGSNTTGAIYQFQTKLWPGNHVYYFYCSSGANPQSAYDPKQGKYQGPNVANTSGNFKPELSDSGVSPSSGTTSTYFSYSVTYTNWNNTGPVIRYVYIDGVPYTMTYWSGDYILGAYYYYFTTLSVGYHNYYFYFADSNGSSCRDPKTGYYYGPYVTYQTSNNTANLTNGSVEPSSGSLSTVFIYNVTYQDSNNTFPASSYVYIDGFPYSMNYVSGSIAQGALFQYQTTLGVGNHTYYFYFTNSNGSIRLPIYGAYYGPAVTYSGGSVTNTPPALSNGFVTPQMGTPSTMFTYQVTYTDIDTNPPVLSNVYIDGTAYSMSYVSGTLSQGVIYQYKTTLNLGFGHTFYFQFADWNASVRLPIAGEYNAPMVTESPPANNPPSLTTGNVSPSSGTVTTLFTFQVTYQDQDNYPPTLKYVYIDGVPCLMNYLSGYYSTGAVFQYQTTLLVGTHNYYYYFSDGQANSRLPTQGNYQGPSVAAGGPPPNNPPYLTSGTVTPQSGQITTVFTYQVQYQDSDGDPPVIKNVNIDNMAFPMTYVSGSNTTGAIYQFKTFLPGGNHTYSFKFSDGIVTANLPLSGTYSGPTVSVPGGANNTTPILFNGSVTPTVGNTSIIYTYNVSYQDLDNDTPVIKIVFIDNQGYQMKYVSGNFTTGALYQYTTKLSSGNHIYYFYFSDGINSTKLPSSGNYFGPNVTGPVPNNKPTLYSGTVYPTTGSTSTVFTCQVLYLDKDNDPPSVKNVYIDGVAHVMYLKYGLYTTGALFEYKISLTEGTHNYYFNFSDGKAFSSLPLNGNYPGPTVIKPNEPPIADAGPDQTITVGPPYTVYFYGVNSSDPNDDELIYYWDFMDGDYAIGLNVSHIFNGVGDYYVSLTIWDGFYTDQDYVVIHVIDSGQGKTKGKAPEKHPTPGFDVLIAIIAIGSVVILLQFKRKRK